MHRVVPVTNENIRFTRLWFSLSRAQNLDTMASPTTRGPNAYRRILDGLMSSVHPHLAKIGQQEFKYKREYTVAEMRQGTPTELVRWLNMRTFGITDPGPNTTIRPLVLANTLPFWKKAISFHMPDRSLHGWQSGSTKQ
jgi:hypothetical protein